MQEQQTQRPQNFRVQQTYNGQNKKKRAYQSWVGSEVFFCQGAIVGGPGWKTCFLTALVVLIPTVLFLTFVAFPIQEPYTVAIFVVGVLLILLSEAFLFMTAFTEPGVIPRQPPDNEGRQGLKPSTKEVYVNGQAVIIRYNATCNFYQPPRAHHCSVNDNCIERFDHHCPWIGTTIGMRNYRTFLLFVLTTTGMCVYVLGICAAYGINRGYKVGAEYRTQGKELHPIDVLRYENVAWALALFIFTTVAFLFIGSLSAFHCWLVAKNQTTYENFRYASANRPNPYDRGCIQNCGEVWCLPIQPSRMRARQYVDEQEVPQTDLPINLYLKPPFSNYQQEVLSQQRVPQGRPITNNNDQQNNNNINSKEVQINKGNNNINNDVSMIASSKNLAPKEDEMDASYQNGQAHPQQLGERDTRRSSISLSQRQDQQVRGTNKKSRKGLSQHQFPSFNRNPSQPEGSEAYQKNLQKISQEDEYIKYKKGNRDKVQAQKRSQDNVLDSRSSFKQQKRSLQKRDSQMLGQSENKSGIIGGRSIEQSPNNSIVNSGTNHQLAPQGSNYSSSQHSQDLNDQRNTRNRAINEDPIYSSRDSQPQLPRSRPVTPRTAVNQNLPDIADQDILSSNYNRHSYERQQQRSPHKVPVRNQQQLNFKDSQHQNQYQQQKGSIKQEQQVSQEHRSGQQDKLRQIAKKQRDSQGTEYGHDGTTSYNINQNTTYSPKKNSNNDNNIYINQNTGQPQRRLNSPYRQSKPQQSLAQHENNFEGGMQSVGSSTKSNETGRDSYVNLLPRNNGQTREKLYRLNPNNNNNNNNNNKNNNNFNILNSPLSQQQIQQNQDLQNQAQNFHVLNQSSKKDNFNDINDTPKAPLHFNGKEDSRQDSVYKRNGSQQQGQFQVNGGSQRRFKEQQMQQRRYVE